jgi:hypothetical protein
MNGEQQKQQVADGRPTPVAKKLLRKAAPQATVREVNKPPR